MTAMRRDPPPDDPNTAAVHALEIMTGDFDAPHSERREVDSSRNTKEGWEKHEPPGTRPASDDRARGPVRLDPPRWNPPAVRTEPEVDILAFIRTVGAVLVMLHRVLRSGATP